MGKNWEHHYHQNVFELLLLMMVIMMLLMVMLRSVTIRGLYGPDRPSARPGPFGPGI